MPAMMWDSSFFLSTRGKVLLLLKKGGPCTVAYLSEQLDLTRNAIRQHLSSLERDNLVTQSPLKTGPGRPALGYSLTPQAEPLFPKQYEHLLSNLIHQLRLSDDGPGVDSLLADLGYSAAGRYVRRLDHLADASKVEEVGRIMEAGGAIIEWEEVGTDVVLRDFNCPYAAVVKEHPEACRVQRSFLQRLLEPAMVDAACDHQQARCRFRIRLSSAGPAAP